MEAPWQWWLTGALIIVSPCTEELMHELKKSELVCNSPRTTGGILRSGKIVSLDQKQQIDHRMGIAPSLGKTCVLDPTGQLGLQAYGGWTNKTERAKWRGQWKGKSVKLLEVTEWPALSNKCGAYYFKVQWFKIEVATSICVSKCKKPVRT